MKKSFYFLAALAISQIGNAQEKQTSDFLEEKFPFEFVARGNQRTEGNKEYQSHLNDLKAGVDIWFKPHWKRLPKEFYGGTQICAIEDNNIIHIIFQCDSSLGGEYHYTYCTCEPSTKIGKLDAGDYTLVLSAIDVGGDFAPASLEIPFSVEENDIAVPKGLVRVGSGMDYIGKNRDKLKYADEGYQPELNLYADDDSLHVVGWLNYTCCMDHYCYYEIHGDSVYLETVQAGYHDMCDCQALHPVDFKIGPYEPTSSCAVETWEYYLGAHSLRIGVTSVFLTEKDNDVFKEISFDLQGRSASETQKGIFVRDGKTVLVK